MNNEHVAFFFEIRKITDDPLTFDKLKKDGSVSAIQNMKLTPRLITQSRVIYLKEIVHYFKYKLLK